MISPYKNISVSNQIYATNITHIKIFVYYQLSYVFINVCNLNMPILTLIHTSMFISDMFISENDKANAQHKIMLGICFARLSVLFFPVRIVCMKQVMRLFTQRLLQKRIVKYLNRRILM